MAGRRWGYFKLTKPKIFEAANDLSKASEYPTPAWILNKGGDAGRVRFTFASRGFGKPAALPKVVEPKKGPSRRPRTSRGPSAGRTYGQRQELYKRTVSLCIPNPERDGFQSLSKEDRVLVTLELSERQSELLAERLEYSGRGFRLNTGDPWALIDELETVSGEEVIVRWSSRHVSPRAALMD